jgi:hypothetical protein
MKTGRNDPCPCGSGRKFKHCCMLAARVSDDAPADLVWRRMRVLLNGHVADMLHFIEHRYGSMALVEAWDEFTCFEDVEFDPQSPFMQLFMPWFFHCWSPDPEATEVLDQSLHGANPTQVYLASRGRRVDPLLRRYLESLLTEAFSYFEVVSCDPGHGMQLRDIMTSEEHQVTERSASKGMQRGDILFGQLAKVERLTMLEASNCFAISPWEKAPIVALRSHIAAAHSPITHEVLRDCDFEMLDLFHEIAERAFDPKLPELQNTDGEPLSPRKLIFDLDIPPQTAFDALKHLALDQRGDNGVNALPYRTSVLASWHVASAASGIRRRVVSRSNPPSRTWHAACNGSIRSTPSASTDTTSGGTTCSKVGTRRSWSTQRTAESLRSAAPGGERTDHQGGAACRKLRPTGIPNSGRGGKPQGSTQRLLDYYYKVKR